LAMVAYYPAGAAGNTPGPPAGWVRG